MAHEDFHRGGLQKGVHVENGLELTLKLVVGHSPDHRTQFGNGAVIVLRGVGLELVHPLIGP